MIWIYVVYIVLLVIAYVSFLQAHLHQNGQNYVAAENDIWRWMRNK